MSCLKSHKGIGVVTTMMFQSLLFLWKEGYGDLGYKGKKSQIKDIEICQSDRPSIFECFFCSSHLFCGIPIELWEESERLGCANVLRGWGIVKV